MVFGAADIIMFGIQAGVRLYGQARQAYVERTRERELVMPLPGLDHQPTVTRAFAYFKDNPDGRRHVVTSARLARLHEMATAGAQAFETNHAAAANEYVELYKFHRLGDAGTVVNETYLLSEVLALNTIAQWRRGETPHPTALRRIAGTITEIGVDFFASGPGASKLAGDSPTKRLLTEVLTALDDFSLVTAGIEDAIEQVFIATLDAIAENPALVSGDPNMQTFVSGIAAGVVSDIQERIDKLPANEQLFAADHLGEVARAVFRSVVRNGAAAILEHPQTFLGSEPGGESAMATRLARIVLDTILPEASTGADRTAIATGEALDKLVQGAFAILAEHPDLMAINNPGIESVVRAVVSELAGETQKLGPDLFPEIARLVLVKTATHLDVLWTPAGVGQNLAVTAIKTLLAELARGPTAGTWQPGLSKTQLFRVVETVLDDLAENPALVTRRVAGKPAIEAAVAAVLAGLGGQQLDNFSSATAAEILSGGVKAAAERWEILEHLPGDVGTGRLALTAIIDTVLTGVTGGDVKATWRLTQGRVLAAIFANAFTKLAAYGVTEDGLDKLRMTLDETRMKLAAGGRFSLDDFASDLENKLTAS